MVLEADDEVICRSEAFISGSAARLAPARWPLGHGDTMRSANQDTYLVLDDFGGNFGRVWRETAEADAKHEMLIRDLLDYQYRCPKCTPPLMPLWLVRAQRQRLAWIMSGVVRAMT